MNKFRSRILKQGRDLYRSMPWRYLDDAYGVMVSEVMLQQTQVARVLQKWTAWMAQYPTLDALAAADTAEVLTLWQGLGYNRRCLNLKRACEQCATEYAGRLPEALDELKKLPGVGPATAAGIVAFAYDKPAVYLETNVRAVFIDEFFPEETAVSDKELIPLVAEACPEEDVRTWYYALLDCGAYLKQTRTKAADPSRRSAHYARQSTFEGSHRQKRAELLRIVLAEPGISQDDAFRQLQSVETQAGRPVVAAHEAETIIEELVREGFFHKVGERLVL